MAVEAGTRSLPILRMAGFTAAPRPRRTAPDVVASGAERVKWWAAGVGTGRDSLPLGVPGVSSPTSELRGRRVAAESSPLDSSVGEAMLVHAATMVQQWRTEVLEKARVVGRRARGVGWSSA